MVGVAEAPLERGPVTTVRFGALELDVKRRTASLHGRSVALASHEAQTLAQLMLDDGAVVTLARINERLAPHLSREMNAT